ncbi:MAG: thiamine ABC transporter substrate-binding protein [Propionibacterium sp.]|nr:thiamine ABC transporter substrate-binding protein [Propionibacterium sp.]
MKLSSKAGLAALAAAASLALAACGSPAAPTTTPAGAGASASAPAGGVVTVLTHDSFALSDAVLAAFQADTGYELKLIRQGDGGSLVNQLVLTKDAPLGDAVYGIDNTFAGRAISAGVLTPYASPKLPADSADLKADVGDALTPTDFGDVCVNADKAWFAAKKLALPVTLDDLTKPEYRDLLVVEDAASSTPGLAFLVGTIGAKTPAGYLDYWGKLKDNGVKVVKDWSAAYYTEFTAGGKGGTRPLVVSYASSPAATVTPDGKDSTTVSLNDTCFRQVEYAGVVKGAKNEAGAKAFVDWMLSEKVQADIPGQMYMYPAVKSTKLPAEWTTFAPLPSTPFAVPAADIAANRDAWIRAWSARVVG